MHYMSAEFKKDAGETGKIGKADIRDGDRASLMGISPGFTHVPIVCVAQAEADLTADLDWALGNHAEPRPDRPATEGELMR